MHYHDPLVVQTADGNDLQNPGSFAVQLGEWPKLPHDKLTWLKVIHDYWFRPCLMLGQSGSLLILMDPLTS